MTPLHRTVIYLLAIISPIQAQAELCHISPNACVTFEKDQTTQRVSILLRSKIQGETLLCFVDTNAGSRRYFELQTYAGPFHHPLVYSSTQYRWRCDLASSRPQWYPKSARTSKV